jgi:hypothetical protein
VGIRPRRGRNPSGLFFFGEKSMFTMIVGRFKIVATSGVKNGSVRVGKSDAIAYDVIDRYRRENPRPEKVGIPFDDAWSYCVRRQASAQGVALLH